MATEKRLIDANALLESIEGTDWYTINYKGDATQGAPCEEVAWYMARDIYSAIENAPTVDAVEVVHGKWELRNVTSGINGRYWCCTACGCIRSYWEYEPDDNYCFKCGAKMDGGTDNG